MTSLRAAGGTHVGLVRRRNEDALHQGEWLFAVADSLGGHVAGDIASTTAVGALTPYDRRVEPDDLAATLGRAISDANEALRRRIRAEPQHAGMGTTLVALMWSEDAAVLANLGDSRAYLMRDRGRLARISEDHTYQHLVAGAATVPTLPGKITRFLDGRQDGRSPDITRHELHAGDRFLLCSDGLSSYVPPDVIEDAPSRGRPRPSRRPPRRIGPRPGRAGQRHRTGHRCRGLTDDLLRAAIPQRRPAGRGSISGWRHKTGGAGAQRLSR